MKLIPNFALLILILLFTTFTADAQIFSGQATGVRATVTTGLGPGVTSAVTDTGPLPSAGGSITLASASASVPGILTAGASNVSTSGAGASSQSTASIATVDVNVAGITTELRVRADAVSSNTSCTCLSDVCTGGTSITNLRVGEIGGGTVITVTGNANQTEQFTVGTVTLTIVINEQIVSPTSITVNPLHITLTDTLTNTTTEVVVSSAHSDISCTPTPALDRYSGRATGVRLATSTLIPQSNVATIVSDTAFLPTSGGNIGVTIAGVSLLPVLSTGVVTSNTSGGTPGGNPDTSQSNSTVNNLSVSLVGDVQITATVLQSNTACTCSTPPAVCTGDSVVTDLVVVVGGINVPIVISRNPNQVIVLPLGLGQLIINEQIPVGSGDLTVNALHVILTPLGLASTDLVIASSHSGIQCQLAPTAAGATLAGRVLSAKHRPVSGARVVLFGPEGVVSTARTNQLGYYTIGDVPVGVTYLVEATHKRHVFTPRSVTMQEDLSEFDFVAEP